MIPEDVLIPSYTVISRHSADCQFKGKSRSYVKCNCKKHIAVYDPGKTLQKSSKHGVPLTQFTIKIKTRDWRAAEQIAQTYRDRHDPDKVRAAKAEAELEALKNRQRADSAVATVEEAVAKFLKYEYDNPRRKASGRSGKAAESTMDNYHNLLGNIVIEHGSPIIKRSGRLIPWLNTLDPRPTYISELTQTLVDDFRASWNEPIPGSIRSKALGDIKQSIAFTQLKTFFNYCKQRGKWISENPLDGVPRPTYEEGYRTAPFNDDQYRAITTTIKNRYPAETKNMEDQKQHEDTHRLLAFIELMRWSGMALADAVRFELSGMLDSGHITYRRVKTGKRAEPTLPARVVTLLREVVPIDNDLNRPFYDKDIQPGSNEDRWSEWAKKIFAEAGIQTVKTEIRDRSPHSHMLRDTFVVNQIRTQKRLGIVDLDSIAKAIGDNEATLRKHYAPWVKELEEAHRASQQRVVDAQMEEEAAKQPQEPKVVSIEGGRK